MDEGLIFPRHGHGLEHHSELGWIGWFTMLLIFPKQCRYLKRYEHAWSFCQGKNKNIDYVFVQPGNSKTEFGSILKCSTPIKEFQPALTSCRERGSKKDWIPGTTRTKLLELLRFASFATWPKAFRLLITLQSTRQSDIVVHYRSLLQEFECSHEKTRLFPLKSLKLTFQQSDSLPTYQATPRNPENPPTETARLNIEHEQTPVDFPGFFVTVEHWEHSESWLPWERSQVLLW